MIIILFHLERLNGLLHLLILRLHLGILLGHLLHFPKQRGLSLTVLEMCPPVCQVQGS